MRDVHTLSETELLNFAEAATLVEVSRQAIEQAVNKGHVPAVIIGGRRFVQKSAAIAYKKNRPARGWPRGRRRRLTT